MSTAKRKLANDVIAPVDPPKTRSKSISDSEMARFRSFLDSWVSQHCRKSDGSLMSQRAIAERLGISSTEYSQYMSDDARPGITRLIKLREATHQSIDAMLGFDLTLPTRQRQEQLDLLARLAGALAEGIREAGIKVSPTTKLGKIITEIERISLAASEQKRLDERARKATA